MSTLLAYLEALKANGPLGGLVVHHEVLPARPASYADCLRPWPVTIERLLAARGIERLYSHQARAMDLLRAGRSVVAATPTASGKTLIYNLPVLEAVLGNPDTRALYIFPLKALAQDQLKGFRELAAAWPKGERPTAAIYDGDTSGHFRKKIRTDPPHVVMTNPEMLHLSILPHHEAWAPFLAGLTHVVVDEVHTYRGVLGSHMAQVFRRLKRVCSRFRVDPAYAFLSATVGNPVELAEQLAGLSVTGVSENGAPAGERHVLFLNPALTMAAGPSAVAIQLLKAALARELRTIVYCQSRKMTELISLWASEKAGEYKHRISAYRAGFLPEERRDIEARMASGDLLAVVSTSALELGIDIGALDLCILVGYPGTVMSTLQRGGRVGRAGQPSAVLLVAGEDALDQYFMRNPRDFFDRPAENAVLNPANEVILGRHLVCAAAELPLREGEPWLAEPGVAEAVRRLELSGGLLRDKDGQTIHASRRRPHREIDLRGAGGTYAIEAELPGGGVANVGQVDERRAFRETHPGAVYLHLGKTYAVRDLDLASRTVRVSPARVDYYTRPRSSKETEVLEVCACRAAFGARVFFGRLRVTETVTGYEKRRVRGGKILTIAPLDLPPLTFETEGLWIEMPREVQRRAEDALMHFMGGIHALEHAAIGILPLLVMTDRNDLGGISTPYHPQVGAAAVFVYDGMPGGVGLTRQAFGMAEELLSRTLCAIVSCACELGCPSCVHSPKCGSGNRPIDKAAARAILEAIRSAPAPTVEDQGILTERPTERPTENHTESQTEESTEEPMPQPVPPATAPPVRYGVLDLETRRSAQEVGGWSRADRMGVSCAVLYDSGRDEFLVYAQDEIPRLVEDIRAVDLVVGFNLKRFDYQVLAGVSDFDFASLPTLDMLEHVYQRLGYRLSLDSLARATLNAAKSADGMQALAWWKEGRLDEIVSYCKQDVAVTRDLYLFGREHGRLLFTNKAGNTVRLPVEWGHWPAGQK
ncbi:MAG: DEAD/DEAH box helicase [Thermodesulfobacteriota bacterium]